MTQEERLKRAAEPERVQKIRESYTKRIEALLENLQFEIDFALDYEEACQNNLYYESKEIDKTIITNLQNLKAEWHQ